MKKLNLIKIGVLSAYLLIFISFAALAAPNKINFQGRLTNSAGQPIDGEVRVRFEIYNQLAGGTKIWPQTPQDGDGIATVTANEAGLFSTQIGPFDDLFFDPLNSYFVEVAVDDFGFQILSPRRELAPVPMAFSAKEADFATTATRADSAVIADSATLAGHAALADAVIPGAIITESLADTSVSTEKLKLQSVGFEQMKADAITDAQIINGSIKSEDIDPTSFLTAGYIIPSGAIMIFLNVCPLGFSEVIELRGRSPFGADIENSFTQIPNSPGVNFGQETHQHGFAVNLVYGSTYEAFDARSVWTAFGRPVMATEVLGSPVSGVGVRGRSFDVEATNAGNTTLTPHIPPARSVVFCSKN